MSNKLLKENEDKILKLTALGLTNNEIAQRMYLSSCTIKVYKESIFRKLNAKNKVEAIIKAYKRGILNLDELYEQEEL